MDEETPGQSDIYCAACGEYGDNCECEQPDKEIWRGGKWRIQNIPLRTRRLLETIAAMDTVLWSPYKDEARAILEAMDAADAEQKG